MTKQLDDRTVVITGASSGIGRASAIAVARRGAQTLLVARRADELATVVAEIEAEGGRAVGYPCDITSSTEVDHTVDVMLQHHDVDMLVNNAGRSIRRSVYHSVDRLHDYERTMAVNYFGALRMTLGLLPHMRERRSGHIVNVSSAGVQVAVPRFSAYLASKAALDKFTEVASAETLADGITFTTVHMPLVETPMSAPSVGTYGRSGASTDFAAAIIVRALVERPKRIDVPTATFMEYAALLAPRLKDRAMHRYYRQFGETPAAKGELAIDEIPTAEPVPMSEVERQARRLVSRVSRLVPGVHW